MSDNHEMPGSITVYRPEMAAEVAAMFNDFNALWPGGFGGGAPYTEQRVHDWLDHTSAVADLIALDAAGTPVGYCGVYPHYRDRHACYVTILGVIPRVKGYKFGKRLLLRAVDLAIERGLTRLDLHTWPGNMNAVPLYKKTGLFWAPETSVYMQNYIPELARSPLAAAWFAWHPDWYSAFDRELTQAPDDTNIDGMALYTYRFVQGDDELVGEIDRYAWGLCGISSTRDGQHIAVRTRVDDHQLRMGMPNALTLLIDNGIGRDLEVALAVEPFEGLAWEEPFPVTLTAPTGKVTTITRGFVVDKDARPYNSQEASQAIRSRVIFDGQVLDLVTGGKIQPAVAIHTQGGYHTAHPGVPTEVPLDLSNHAGTSLTGTLNAFVEGGAGSGWTLPFELAPGEVNGATVPVPAGDFGEDGAATAHFTVTINRDGQTYPMPTTRLPLVSSVPARPVVVHQPNPDELQMLSDTLSLYANLKGGYVNMGRRDSPDLRRSATFEIGPPFGLSLDSSLTYDYRIDRNGEATTLVLVADSLQFPGLRLARHYRMRPASLQIEHWVTVTALSATPPAAGGRFNTHAGGGGLRLDPYIGLSETYTPVGDRIVVCATQFSLLNDTVVPQDAAAWVETWTAQRTVFRGDLAALIWEPGLAAQVRVDAGMLRELEVPPVQLQPGETVELAHLWYDIGLASPADVRRRWMQLVSRREPRLADANIGLARAGALVRPVEARWTHHPPLPAGDSVPLTLQLDFTVPVRLPGELRLALPEGWTGSFLPPDGPADALPMPQPDVAGVVALPVVLTPPATAAGTVGAIALHYRGEYEIQWELPLLVGSPAPITIAEHELEARPLIHIANDHLGFDIVADRGGGLIHLEDASGYAYLDDVFPDCQAKFFVTDYVGGAQPIVFHANAAQPFYPPEALTATERVTEGVWQGAQVTWTTTGDERLRGQRFAITYLVAPGLPVVRLRLTRTAPTDRRFNWLGGFLMVLDRQAAADLGPLGFTMPGTSHAWNGARPLRHFPAPQGAAGPMDPDQPWAWLHIGDGPEERSLGILGIGGATGTPVAFDFGEFVGAFLSGVQESGTRAESLEYALVLNRPSSEAKAWHAALRCING